MVMLDGFRTLSPLPKNSPHCATAQRHLTLAPHFAHLGAIVRQGASINCVSDFFEVRPLRVLGNPMSEVWLKLWCVEFLRKITPFPNCSAVSPAVHGLDGRIPHPSVSLTPAFWPIGGVRDRNRSSQERGCLAKPQTGAPAWGAQRLWSWIASRFAKPRTCGGVDRSIPRAAVAH